MNEHSKVTRVTTYGGASGLKVGYRPDSDSYIVLFDGENVRRLVPRFRIASERDTDELPTQDTEPECKPTYQELEQRVKTLEARISELEAMVGKAA